MGSYNKEKPIISNVFVIKIIVYVGCQRISKSYCLIHRDCGLIEGFYTEVLGSNLQTLPVGIYVLSLCVAVLLRLNAQN